MPSINGIDFNNISSLNGVSWNSVSNIGGVPVSHTPPASCTLVSYGFESADGDPNNACLARPMDYDYDATNNLLYVAGGCGSVFADRGFYSDGRTIFFWDGFLSFFPMGSCGR